MTIDSRTIDAETGGSSESHLSILAREVEQSNIRKIVFLLEQYCIPNELYSSPEKIGFFGYYPNSKLVQRFLKHMHNSRIPQHLRGSKEGGFRRVSATPYNEIDIPSQIFKSYDSNSKNNIDLDKRTEIIPINAVKDTIDQGRNTLDSFSIGETRQMEITYVAYDKKANLYLAKLFCIFPSGNAQNGQILLDVKHPNPGIIKTLEQGLRGILSTKTEQDTPSDGYSQIPKDWDKDLSNNSPIS